MRRVIFGIITMFAVVALAMPASAATVLKFSSIHEPNHPSAYTAEFFASRVKQLTKGEVDVQVYHSRQLGDARDNVENVRNGSIAFTSVSISNLSQVMPAMDAWSLPFIFKSDDHYWYCLNDPKAMEFMKQLEPKGIKTITWITSGARNFFTQKPIRTPADMKGMKIRVMASPVMIDTMKAMGASGVPVAWGELYTALQTGVVDGGENNHPSVISMKFYEVSKFYTIDEHMRIPDVNIISTKVFEKLSKSQQAAILKAGEEATAYMRGAWKVAEVEDLNKIKGLMKEVITVDKKPFMEAVAPLVKESAKKLGAESFVDWVLATGKNF
ncbi:MAG: TRAP transporter substrate-binding protein [candidate division NC10 bacterium]|nr:TRAP transporter substrate-binding protein [candidate division NC10 bacterium]